MAVVYYTHKKLYVGFPTKERKMRKELEVISRATLFGGIKGEELEKLLVCMDSTRKKYRRQEMILSEEEIPDRIGGKRTGGPG